MALTGHAEPYIIIAWSVPTARSPSKKASVKAHFNKTFSLTGSLFCQCGGGGHTSPLGTFFFDLPNTNLASQLNINWWGRRY